MPLVFLGILVALPVLDIYATLRFAEALNVPSWLLFVPGIMLGAALMKRETRMLKSRFVGAMQSLALHSMVFDSGRRMLAAALLLTPGFLSDVFAVFLLLIPNRAVSPPVVAVTPAGPKTVEGEFRRVE
jgi:UPF0716 family protein affecting phage T7 exclusion